MNQVLAALPAGEDRDRCRRELEDHLDALYAAARAEGHPPDRARSAALDAFGAPPELAASWAGSVHAAPLWPAVVWLTGLVLSVTPLAPTGAFSIGTGAGALPLADWLRVWAIIWALGHWPSFRALPQRIRARSLKWRGLGRGTWEAIWPFGVYGAAVGALALQLWPAYHAGGPLWPLFAVGLAGLAACWWRAGRAPATYPLGAGLATAAAFAAMLAGWTLYPAWMAAPWGEPLTPLGLATVLAALFFTLQGALLAILSHAFPTRGSDSPPPRRERAPA